MHDPAQSGHNEMSALCPLSGVKRTSNARIEFFLLLTHFGSRALVLRSVCRPQQRVERIAIERVPGAWKCSTENRPYGGGAQVVSSAGRPLSKFMRHPRALKDYVLALEARKTRRILVGCAPIRPNNSSRISRQRLAER